jgi:hypothetical protein
MARRIILENGKKNKKVKRERDRAIAVVKHMKKLRAFTYEHAPLFWDTGACRSFYLTLAGVSTRHRGVTKHSKRALEVRRLIAGRIEKAKPKVRQELRLHYLAFVLQEASRYLVR